MKSGFCSGELYENVGAEYDRKSTFNFCEAVIYGQ